MKIAWVTVEEEEEEVMLEREKKEAGGGVIDLPPSAAARSSYNPPRGHLWPSWSLFSFAWHRLCFLLLHLLLFSMHQINLSHPANIPSHPLLLFWHLRPIPWLLKNDFCGISSPSCICWLGYLEDRCCCRSQYFPFHFKYWKIIQNSIDTIMTLLIHQCLWYKDISNRK